MSLDLVISEAEVVGPEYRAWLVPVTQVGRWWFALEDLMRKVPDTWSEYMTLDEIERATFAGNFDLWLVTDRDDPGLSTYIFILAGMVQYPSKLVYRISWAYGDGIDHYLDLLLAGFENHAKTHGADLVEITGRKGWDRKCAPFGYVQTHTTLTKRVHGIREH